MVPFFWGMFAGALTVAFIGMMVGLLLAWVFIKAVGPSKSSRQLPRRAWEVSDAPAVRRTD
jgi:uncharacterized membrane protein YccC